MTRAGSAARQPPVAGAAQSAAGKQGAEGGRLCDIIRAVAGTHAHHLVHAASAHLQGNGGGRGGQGSGEGRQGRQVVAERSARICRKVPWAAHCAGGGLLPISNSPRPVLSTTAAGRSPDRPPSCTMQRSQLSGPRGRTDAGRPRSHGSAHPGCTLQGRRALSHRTESSSSMSLHSRWGGPQWKGCQLESGPAQGCLNLGMC